MKKILSGIGCLMVMASCGRYSQVVELPKKDQKEANSRVYGEVDGPARQSKQTWPAAADAAEKSARIKDVMFGKGAKATPVERPETAPSAPLPADSAAAK